MGTESGIRNMTAGSPFRHILMFTLPLLAGNFLQQFYNMVDSWVVGNFVSDGALAAVGVGFPVIFLFTSLFSGIATGGTVVIAQAFGGGRPDRVRSAIDSLYTAFIRSILPITAAALLLVNPLMTVLRVDPAAWAETRTYLLVVCAGLVGSIGYNLNAGILGGMGNSSTTLLFLAVSGLLAFVLYAGAQMRPLLGSLATTRVSNAVNRIVYQAVNEAIDSGQIAYEQLVSYEKDNEGRITMVRSNMAAFNRLQSQILDLILGRIDQVSARELSIPVGSLTGSPLLAGRGPRISVRMESVGSSSARFENQFESAGINQTKHRIVLRIDVYVSILLPGYSTVTQVTNEITVAETVIVGEVPGTYTYFATDPDAYAGDAKDYILNKD